MCDRNNAAHNWTKCGVVMASIWMFMAATNGRDAWSQESNPGSDDAVRQDVVVSGESADEASDGFEEELPAAAPLSTWQLVVIHHSATNSGSVEEFDAEHRRRKDANGQPWLGIAYHFVIGNGHGMDDGAIEATFRWKQQLHGAHSGDATVNARGIGICLVGNFEESPPTTRQWEAVQKLVRRLAAQHQLKPEQVVGHASVKKTSCPGRYFPLEKLRGVVAVE